MNGRANQTWNNCVDFTDTCALNSILLKTPTKLLDLGLDIPSYKKPSSPPKPKLNYFFFFCTAMPPNSSLAMAHTLSYNYNCSFTCLSASLNC